MGGFSLLGLSDLYATGFMNANTVDLTTFSPSSAGPQNQNVIDYSGAVAASGVGGSGGPTNPPKCSGVGCPAGSPTGSAAPYDPVAAAYAAMTGIGLPPTPEQAALKAQPQTGVLGNAGPLAGGLSFGRAAAFIGGLIFIAGGIYMMKSGEINLAVSKAALAAA